MRIKRKELSEALKTVSLVAEQKSINMPILSMCLINGPEQCIMGTNLETSIRVSLAIEDFEKEVAAPEVPADLLEGLQLHQLKSLAEDYGIAVPKKPTVPNLQKAIVKACTEAYEKEKVVQERFCLPAQRLRKIVQSLTDETVEIVPAGGGNDLFNHQQRVSIGSNFVGLATLPWDEFPVFVEPDLSAAQKIVEDGQEIELTGGTNRISSEKLGVVLPAALKGAEKGFKLSLVCFDAKNGNVVSTDGHRLHMLSGMKLEKDMLMSMDFAKVLISLKQKEDLAIETDGRSIKVKMGGTLVIGRCAPMKFPDYLAVIPKKSKHNMSVTREALEAPLKQSRILENETYRGIKVKFNGGIDIELSNPDVGQYQKLEVPITAGGIKGDPVEMGINPRYILDALATSPKSTDTFNVGVTDNASPVTFKHGNFTGLVMPMRI